MTKSVDRLPDTLGIEGWTGDELAELAQFISAARNRWPGPESLGAPTDEEVEALSQGVAAGARIRLREASRAFYIAKMRSNDKTPWRDLVAAHRAGEPGCVEMEVIGLYGARRLQVVCGDPGFGLKGDAASLFKAGAEFTLALEMIEAERESNRQTGAGGGRPLIDRSNINTALNALIKQRGRDKLLAKSISWIVERLKDELPVAAAADQPQLSDNTLRSAIAAALPEHPKLKKNKTFNNGGS